MNGAISLTELVQIRKQLKQQAKKVVFTNGCFDILHRGHVEYLTKAKTLGDILIVGMNTDASVRRLKGPQRPIVCEDDRAFVLVSLKAVDYVCLFDQDTPLEIISRLLPDVLVKGSDWDVKSIVGKDIVEAAGGKVQTIEFVPNRSTTNIIKKITNSES